MSNTVQGSWDSAYVKEAVQLLNILFKTLLVKQAECWKKECRKEIRGRNV